MKSNEMHKKDKLRILLLLGALSMVNPTLAADRVLLDPAALDTASIPTADAALTKNGKWLSVSTAHNQPWPGITLKAPGGHWDLSANSYVTVELNNPGARAVTVHCRVDNPGANGTDHCNNGQVTLQRGQTGTVQVDISRDASPEIRAKLFGMRGYPVGGGEHGTIDPSNVTQILLFVAQPNEDYRFDVGLVRAGGTYFRPSVDAAHFFPFIDTFGQYIHRDWPGKVHSFEELLHRRKAEAADLKQHPGPADWDQYGGWQGKMPAQDGRPAEAAPVLKATGFFRIEKYAGKWWLVDPLGHLFFSNGIDCVGEQDFTPVDERSTWFQDYPGQSPEFKPFQATAHALMGHYAGKDPLCFDFSDANLRRKYGANWEHASDLVTHQRLRSWGLNTIGNWSSERIYDLRKTPYVGSLGTSGRLIEGSSGYWGKFIDPFDTAVKTNLDARMKQEIGKSAGDPWCLGYFVDNEMSWGDETSLALGAIQSPADQPAKIAFVEDLKKKYGAIENLNDAWGSKYASWDNLLSNRSAPDAAKAKTDMQAFTTHLAEQYFKTVRDSLKAAAPHQLYLGCRFAAVNPLAANAAAKYADVVSFNIYQRSIEGYHPATDADVPMIIGEFHCGALDRGMFHPGLVATRDQDERAKVYEGYVQSVLRNPRFVGCHWFKYRDEPTTGRSWDGENYQIGFVDVADTPYNETITAARRVGASLYSYRLKH